MPIEVTMKTKCDRCKRETEQTVSSDQLAEFEAQLEEAEAQRQKVLDFAEENKGALPDLVLIFKGDVRMFGNVCEDYCTKPVQNIIETLFKERAPRRRRRTKAEIEADKKSAEAKKSKEKK